MTNRYQGFRLEIDGAIAKVTFDHPPMNIIDQPMMRSLSELAKQLAEDDTVHVVVCRSAHPKFFLAHVDVKGIQGLPRDDEERHERLSGIHRMMERWRTLPQVTIAQIEGFTRGGGSEFVLSLDMRFGAVGKAVLGQPEVALGIIPGAGGTQRLAELLGRSRALEVVLGADDYDAELAERYGWINRSLLPDEIGPFVDRLANRMAKMSPDALRLAKQAVLEAHPSPAPGLIAEDQLFRKVMNTPNVDERIERFFALGAQTEEAEQDLPSLIDEVNNHLAARNATSS